MRLSRAQCGYSSYSEVWPQEVSWPGQTPNSTSLIIDSTTAMRYCSAFTVHWLGRLRCALKTSHMSIEVHQEIAGAASQNRWTKDLLVALECRLDAKLRCAPPPAGIRGLGAGVQRCCRCSTSPCARANVLRSKQQRLPEQKAGIRSATP